MRAFDGWRRCFWRREIQDFRVRAKAGVIAGTDTECILGQFGQLDHLVRVTTAAVDTLKTATTEGKQKLENHKCIQMIDWLEFNGTFSTIRLLFCAFES